MCYLISLGVPERHARSLRATRLPRVDRQENPSISAMFGEELAQFSVTDGQCSCSLYSVPDKEGDSARVDARRQKYERMGWSRAKIDRALADAERPQPARSGVTESVASTITDLAESCGEVRMIVHVYRGSFAEERVRVHETREITPADLRGAARYDIEVDTLYVIR
ncbi:MAG TPA: hypothetical protein VGF48_14430 [Thermoanaerobaculia bacterium]|jgi:hypothetical protein